jgi:hypothetical protein
MFGVVFMQTLEAVLVGQEGSTQLVFNLSGDIAVSKQVISQVNTLPGILLPLNLDSRPGNRVLTYQVGNLVSLAAFLSSHTVSIDEICTILRKFTQTLMDSRNQSLQLERFSYDPRYIFWDAGSAQVKLVYYPFETGSWPMSGYQGLMRNIAVDWFTPPTGEDSDRVERFKAHCLQPGLTHGMLLAGLEELTSGVSPWKPVEAPLPTAPREPAYAPEKKSAPTALVVAATAAAVLMVALGIGFMLLPREPLGVAVNEKPPIASTQIDIATEPAPLAPEPEDEPAEAEDNPTEAVDNPAEPAAEPAESTEDLLAPTEEPALPVAELTDPAGDSVELTAEPREAEEIPEASAPETVNEPLTSAEETPEPAAEPTEATAEPTEPAAEPTEAAAEPTEATAEPTATTPEPSASNAPTEAPTATRPETAVNPPEIAWPDRDAVPVQTAVVADYLRAGQIGSAVKAFVEAVKYDLAAVYLQRGEELADRGLYAEAAEDFQTAISLGADAPAYYLLLADSYLALNDSTMALAVLESGLATTADELLNAKYDQLRPPTAPQTPSTAPSAAASPVSRPLPELPPGYIYRSQVIWVTGINAYAVSTSIQVGEISAIIASTVPANATDRRIFYISYDPSIVNVDMYGRFEGIRPGRTTLSASTRDGDYYATFTITVTK